MLTKYTSSECECKFMVKKLIQIKNGIVIHVNASIKNIIYVKKIIFAILLHVVAKILNI